MLDSRPTPPIPISGDEMAFLTYLACRIDGEVERFHQCEQDRSATLWSIDRLTDLAEDILGEAEVAGWLEASTLAPLVVEEAPAVLTLAEISPQVWQWQPEWDPD